MNIIIISSRRQVFLKPEDTLLLAFIKHVILTAGSGTEFPHFISKSPSLVCEL